MLHEYLLLFSLEFIRCIYSIFYSPKNAIQNFIQNFVFIFVQFSILTLISKNIIIRYRNYHIRNGANHMTNLLSEEKSLPQKISEDIITLILEENLQPGDKLPNETILSERLNAGRSSVREAMKLLASRNIVTIRQGSGTYIASSPGMVDDPLGFTFIGNKQKLINDLLEVRFLLEPPIAAMAATRADKKDIKKITPFEVTSNRATNSGLAWWGR